MQFSSKYILGFALGICLVCSLVVSAFAVSLKEKQRVNRELDIKLNVLRVSGLIDKDAVPSAEEIAEYYTKISPMVIERKSGRVLDEAELTILGIDINTFDPVKAAKDPNLGQSIGVDSARRAQVRRVPDYLLVSEVKWPDHESYVFQIWGNGLWSTLYGFLCLEKDAQTIKGITYYDHLETPGLGGEVDNQKWKAMWPGKQVYGEDGGVAIHVIKGTSQDDHSVDGLSGATITSNGVTSMLQLWLGEEGYGKFLGGKRSPNEQGVN